MFTSQSLRAVVKPGTVAMREQRLDDVVHQIDVRGALAALVTAGRELRSRKGELILAGGGVGPRLATLELGHRPAVAANVDQAVMILKMLRPKTDIRPQRAKQRITSLTLPRIEPPATA